MEKARELATKPGATEMDKMVFECGRCYTRFLTIMDEGGMLLTEEQAEELYVSVRNHLLIYGHLNKLGRRLKGKTAGRNLWLLLPKHHHMYHMAHTVREEQINPAFYTLLTAEDFMGKIGRISKTCHRNTVSQRTLERYLASIFLRLS